MLPFFVNYLHVKNIRKQLIPNRGINDKRILNLIGWEHFRSYLKKQFFPRYETFAESKSAQLCTIFQLTKFLRKAKKTLTNWNNNLLTYWHTEYLSVFSTNVGKIRTRKTPNTDTFHSVWGSLIGLFPPEGGGPKTKINNTKMNKNDNLLWQNLVMGIFLKG